LSKLNRRAAQCLRALPRKHLQSIQSLVLVFFTGAVIFLLPPRFVTAQQQSSSSGSQEQEAAAATVAPAAYRIGPGDILDISVWKDEALTKRIPVLPDGTISFPLVGKLTAAGHSLEAFKRELEDRISRYVPDPVISVSIHQVNSMMVYVIGRVNSPGRIILNGNVTALQALAMAGGPNPFAKRNKIKIFREETDQTRIFDFPYDDISQGEHLEYNIEMKRGDVMVVP
jgi:polysaccharide export outer membrane protein